ncbi:shikimate dehydrogenase [Ignisphaera sp. 4213-co]|uniref:Shikimate dehydrogenase (NADP(+)) n=1 Tax=Ignisphaera cupida TaxID=3050454 RepID=A0ABD4Z516_9CREN|nr:shikimate dehydrogenase [Ignisphaera sp. 4213-co]MDK6028092.1 shikimate dehydrogenase [Ignisphaera sp. 4213-co]
MHLIDAKTKIFGVLGHNISYTLSPAIHNYIFMEIGYNAVYLVFDVPENKFDYVAKALIDICEGFNVTIPYKEKIIPYLTHLDKSAEIIGAVNTVYRGRGYNTDYIATKKLFEKYRHSLEKGICYIFGAGGAARAAAAALGEQGCSIRIVNRSVDRALKMAKDLRKIVNSIEVANTSTCEEAEVIVNATPDPSFIPDKCLHNNLKLVIEFVYRPVETLLVKKAIEKGIPVINGLEILVAQALEAQRIWLGIEFPFEKVVGYLHARKLIW